MKKIFFVSLLFLLSCASGSMTVLKGYFFNIVKKEVTEQRQDGAFIIKVRISTLNGERVELRDFRLILKPKKFRDWVRFVDSKQFDPYLEKKIRERLRKEQKGGAL